MALMPAAVGFEKARQEGLDAAVAARAKGSDSVVAFGAKATTATEGVMVMVLGPAASVAAAAATAGFVKAAKVELGFAREETAEVNHLVIILF